MRLRLELPWPPSSNRYWRASKGRGLVPSDEAIAYKRRVAFLAPKLLTFKGPVRVEVRAFRPRAIGDLDNVLKVLFDALSGVIWLDDEQVQELAARRFDDPQRPRVEIEVEGEELATLAEVEAHRDAKREAAQKRKKTLALNRAAKRLRATPAVHRSSR